MLIRTVDGDPGDSRFLFRHDGYADILPLGLDVGIELADGILRFAVGKI